MTTTGRHGRLKVFAGRSHKTFTGKVCQELEIQPSPRQVIDFSNQNILVKIGENVRDADVFWIATMSPTPKHGQSINDGLMETFIAIDALKSASAERVTVVLPCMPYARGDKKDQPRISVTARLVADLLQTAGADRVLTMDLHSPQVHGFFRIPVDHLTGIPVLCQHIHEHWGADPKTHVLVAGDAGEAKDVGRFANRLHLPIAVIDKRRQGNDDTAKAVNLIGNVEGLHAIIVDDEIATAGTIEEGAKFLLSRGALSVNVAATHGVLSGRAIERINNGPFQHVLVTDTTLPFARDPCPKLETVSVAPLFADAIKRIHNGDSVSDLFNGQ